MNNIQTNVTSASPLVKWAGGKRSIMNELTSRMPNKINNYYEPFVGGGAVFFATQFNNANLSDLNSDLIMVYNVVKTSPNELIEMLKNHAENHTKEYFYEVRSQHDLTDPIEIAARFMYLNKTCFNGLYRVNKSGKFNVPYGSYKRPNIVQEENILKCNKVLQEVSVSHISYDKIDVKPGDFVYFDPPYYPENGTYFTTYTKYGFSKKDHIKLRDFASKLCNNGVKVMISNSNTPTIKELYDTPQFNIDMIIAPRYISCNGKKRVPAKELIITGGYNS